MTLKCLYVDEHRPLIIIIIIIIIIIMASELRKLSWPTHAVLTGSTICIRSFGWKLECKRLRTVKVVLQGVLRKCDGEKHLSAV